MSKETARLSLESALQDPNSVISARALVLSRDERSCLLLQRSMFHKANVGLFEVPGGKLEPEEKERGIQGVIDAMQRETEEESGLATRYEHGLWIIESRPASAQTVARFVVSGVVSVIGGNLRNFDQELKEDPLAQPEHVAARWHPIANEATIDSITMDTIRIMRAYINPTSQPCLPVHRRDAIAV